MLGVNQTCDIPQWWEDVSNEGFTMANSEKPNKDKIKCLESYQHFILRYIYWIFSAKGAGSDELSTKDETTEQYLK